MIRACFLQRISVLPIMLPIGLTGLDVMLLEQAGHIVYQSREGIRRNSLFVLIRQRYGIFQHSIHIRPTHPGSIIEIQAFIRTERSVVAVLMLYNIRSVST